MLSFIRYEGDSYETFLALHLIFLSEIRICFSYTTIHFNLGELCLHQL